MDRQIDSMMKSVSLALIFLLFFSPSLFGQKKGDNDLKVRSKQLPNEVKQKIFKKKGGRK